jgi:VWFA-related protein
VSGLAAVLLAATAAAPALPTFESVVETVRLDVSVMEGGRPVRFLRAENFEVEDEGVRQRIELIGQEATAVHAVLTLDTSQSVEGPRLARLKTAAHAFVRALRADDALTFVTFAECVDVAVVGSRDRAEAHAAIDRATTRGTTGLHDAALAALTLADPALGRPLVLVFSDGQDAGSTLSDDRVAELARDSEAVIHAVLPPGSPPSAFLSTITDETGGRIWLPRESDSLDQVFVQALDEFRSRYRLRFEPAGRERKEWHRLKVRLTGARGRVRARPGYRPRKGGP